MLRLSAALILALSPATAWAQTATPTAADIRACEADRTGPGCATLRTQLFVCQAANAMAGCAELLALRDAALAEPEPEPEPESEVTPRAEGQLTEDASADTTSGVDVDGDAGQPVAEAEGACPVIDATDWRAVLGPVEGAEGLHLIVEGRVTLPTPGWTVALAAGMADRSAIPAQRVVLTAAPPEGMVAQVLTDYDLRLATPALAPAYRGVSVDCAGLALVELTEVGVAP